MAHRDNASSGASPTGVAEVCDGPHMPSPPLVGPSPSGDEIELDHPNDPIGVLNGDTSGGTATSNIASESTSTAFSTTNPKVLQRKVSFLSSPLAPPSGSRAKVPIVKIMNTSRSDINGKFGYVHAYYRARERYAVTLLAGDERHPALIYFDGVPRVEDIKRNRDHSSLFLPPTAVVQLQALDIITLYLQYIALHVLGSPRLAQHIGHIMDFLRNHVLSPLRMENLSAFLLVILPVCLARLYKMLMSRLDTLNKTDFGGPGRVIFTLPSNVTSAISGRMSEFFTVSLLLIGTSVIARFLVSEYQLVKEKAEAMLAHQSDGQKQKSFSFMEMFEYRIDYYFSTSKWAKVVLLLSFTFILIAVGAGLLIMFSDDHSISNAVWLAWTYVADPGTHADCPETFLVRLISFTITLGGMLIFALMIGIISEYIAEKVDDLKKGKSRIIDIDHTVMLGWNDKSLSIIQQVALANESEGGGCIVVLAENDKEELEETLASAVASSENPLRLLDTEVIFRSGNPLIECELRRVSIQTARSIISLSSEELEPDEADSTQVRQIMALKAFDEFVGSKCHVVVEVQDVDNKDLFPLVAPDFAEVIVTHDIIGRLMLQCARCPGLAPVLESMMGFEGSEFYFEEWPELTGKTFHDITCRFDDAVPIGIKSFSDGEVLINPENDQVIKEGDKILVLAEDNDSYEVNDGGYDMSNVGEVPKLLEETKLVERILFCGWRRDMADLILQLDEYVEKGSELWLFNMVPTKDRATLLKDKGNKEDLVLHNLNIRNVVGNPVIRRDLMNIKAVDDEGKATGQSITLDQFDSILILADAVAIEKGANMMSCDSRSLSSLLIIQDIQKKLYDGRKRTICPKVPCSPISEILDSRTKSLLSVANCKGYIMSNQIISSVIAQVSEEKDINIVLREILTAEGSETYIRPVERFVDLEKESELSFWDVALRVRQLREVAIGYKPAGIDFNDAEELIINPPDKSIKRKWCHGDVVVTFSID